MNQRDWELRQIEDAARTLWARSSDPFRHAVTGTTNTTKDTHYLRLLILKRQNIKKAKLP